MFFIPSYKKYRHSSTILLFHFVHKSFLFTPIYILGFRRIFKGIIKIIVSIPSVIKFREILIKRSFYFTLLSTTLAMFSMNSTGVYFPFTSPPVCISTTFLPIKNLTLLFLCGILFFTLKHIVLSP